MKLYFYFIGRNCNSIPCEELYMQFEFDPTLQLLPMHKGFVVYTRELKEWELKKHDLIPFMRSC